MDVAEQGENLLGIAQMLVDIIKITQHHFAPAIELLQCLVLASHMAIGFVEFADEFDAVSQSEFRQRLEDFADGGVSRTPDGVVAQLRQRLVEKQCSTLVGEHNRHLVKVCSVLLQYVFGNGL